MKLLSVIPFALLLVGQANAGRSSTSSFEKTMTRFASQLMRETAVVMQKAAVAKAAAEEEARKTFIVNMDHQSEKGPITLQTSDDYDATVIRRAYSQKRGLTNYYCMDVTATETRRLVDDIGLVHQSSWDKTAPIWLTIEDDDVEIQSHRVYFRPHEKVTTVTSCVVGETPEDPNAFKLSFHEKSMLVSILALMIFAVLVEAGVLDLLVFLYDFVVVRQPNVGRNETINEEADVVHPPREREEYTYGYQPPPGASYPSVSAAELDRMLHAAGLAEPPEVD